MSKEPNSMSFKDFFYERHPDKKPKELLLEYEEYKIITGTKNSYRVDTPNTSTLVDKHAHVYAKLKGKGEELYSVTVKGKGHDGYSGTPIPQKHADFFRRKGYDIPSSNILESIALAELDGNKHSLITIDDEGDSSVSQFLTLLNEKLNE